MAVDRDARARRRDRAGARDGGAVVLAVCAGFQLIGHRYDAADGDMLDGLGLVDAITARRVAAASSAR